MNVPLDASKVNGDNHALAMLPTALQYASRGWRVFPVHTPTEDGCSCGNPECGKHIGKHPRTKQGLSDATTDEATIRAWWARWPAANIGIATGPASNLFVVDLDGDFELPDALQHLPRTITAKTSRGRHLLFTYPQTGKRYGNKTKVHDLSIDVRGAGGYIIAEPSLHKSGARYEWLIGPDDCELAEAPAKMLEWLYAPKRPAPSQAEHTNGCVTKPSAANGPDVMTRARAYLEKCPPAIEGSNGSGQLMKTLRLVIDGFALDDGQAREIAFEYSATCQPPWNEKEIEHALESIKAKPAGQARGWLNQYQPATEANSEPAPGQRADENPPHQQGDAYEGPPANDSVFGFSHRKESKKPNPKSDSEFGFPVVASKLQATAAPLAWLWRGFIAEKGITLFSALWKIGKTTLLAHLVRNMGKGVALCGYEVTPATVLYITEESETRWAKRRDALGIGDNVRFLCRPFKAKPTIAKWLAFIQHVQEQAAAIGAHLIVFDTLSALWPVHNENDAGEVQAALMPLWNLASGSALLLVHHLKKGDGQEATGSRGSGALPGFVDTIIELRRHDAHDRHSRKRVIAGYGRDEETPAEIVVELDAETNEYRGLGDRKGAKREEIKRTLLRLLPTERPGMTQDEIKEAWPDDKVPTKKTMLDALHEGAERGDWARDGEGRKKSPYRFFLPSDKTA